MTITITINRSSVKADLRVKSNAEAAAISDVEERYIVEAGTEKGNEIDQCITDAFTEVQAILRRFITGANSSFATDGFDSTGDLSLSLEVSARKSGGLAGPLANAVHKYVVNSAMAKFYRSVSRTAMAQPHEAALPSDKANIDALVYIKKDPTY